MKDFQIIPCPVCGQMINVETDMETDYSTNDLQQLALKECTCPAGRVERAIETQIREAQANMFALCGEGSQEQGFEPIANPDIFDVLEKIIELTGRGELLDVTVKVSGFGKIKINKDSKERINVQRSVGTSATLSANSKQ